MPIELICANVMSQLCNNLILSSHLFLTFTSKISLILITFLQSQPSEEAEKFRVLLALYMHSL